MLTQLNAVKPTWYTDIDCSSRSSIPCRQTRRSSSGPVHTDWNFGPGLSIAYPGHVPPFCPWIEFSLMHVSLSFSLYLPGPSPVSTTPSSRDVTEATSARSQDRYWGQREWGRTQGQGGVHNVWGRGEIL